jgi:hypothetical protein
LTEPPSRVPAAAGYLPVSLIKVFWQRFGAPTFDISGHVRVRIDVDFNQGASVNRDAKANRLDIKPASAYIQDCYYYFEPRTVEVIPLSPTKPRAVG